jgi:capsular exopolysaccharide synthesis family protein
MNAQTEMLTALLAAGRGRGGSESAPLLDVIVRRKMLALATALAAAAAVIGLGVMLPQDYAARATLQISAADAARLGAVVAAEAERMRAPALVEAVVVEQRLDRDPFWAAGASAGAAPEALQRDAAVRLGERLSVRPQRNGLVAVVVRAPAPEPAAAAANALVRAYLENAAARAQATGLAPDLDALQRDVETRAAELEALRAALERPSRTEPRPEAQPDATAERAALAAQTATLDDIDRALASDGEAEIRAVAARPIGAQLDALLTRETELKAREAELLERVLARHPDLVAVQEQRVVVRASIRAELERLQGAAQAGVAAARAKLKEAEGLPAVLPAPAPITRADRARLAALEEALLVARAAYDEAAGRSGEEATGASGFAAEIVALASPPARPQAPPLWLVFLVAGLAAAAAGASAATIAEALDTKLRTAVDVERKLALPVAASIPIVPTALLRGLDPSERHPPGYLLERPMSPFAESIRMLRASILLADLDRKQRVVAITSALPTDGKTSCALALARASAVAGQKTVLIDCDLRRRSLNELLGISPHHGIQDVLSGALTWRKVVARDEFSGCHVIPAGENTPPTRDVFGSPAMEEMIKDLIQHYSFVVIDCPPALVVTDARMLVRHADAAILVARSGRTPAKAVKAAYDELGAASLAYVAVAMNCVPPDAASALRFGGGAVYREAYKRYYST